MKIYVCHRKKGLLKRDINSCRINRNWQTDVSPLIKWMTLVIAFKIFAQNASLKICSKRLFKHVQNMFRNLRFKPIFKTTTLAVIFVFNLLKEGSVFSFRNSLRSHGIFCRISRLGRRGAINNSAWCFLVTYVITRTTHLSRVSNDLSVCKWTYVAVCNAAVNEYDRLIAL